jgi:hypothetical protein
MWAEGCDREGEEKAFFAKRIVHAAVGAPRDESDGNSGQKE